MIVGMKSKYKSWLIVSMLLVSQPLMHAHWSDYLAIKRWLPVKTPTMKEFLSKYGVAIGIGAAGLLPIVMAMLRALDQRHAWLPLFPPPAPLPIAPVRLRAHHHPPAPPLAPVPVPGGDAETSVAPPGGPRMD